MRKETEMMTKQTTARAHVGVYSRDRPDASPPAMILSVCGGCFYCSFAVVVVAEDVRRGGGGGGVL